MVRLVLLRLLESYFRHRWLYFIPVVLLTAAGIASELLKEEKYIAGGVLYVQQESFLATLTSVRDSSVSWWETPAEATVDEIVDLLQTDAFMRAVVGNTDLETNMDLGQMAIDETIDKARESIWVNSNGENQITINAAHVDAQIAYQLVNATIDNYIQWKINTDRSESEVAQLFFDELTEQYRTELELVRDELERYLIENPTPLRGDRPEAEQLEIERLQAELQLAGTRYARALEKDENAQLAIAQTESDVRQSYFLLDAPRIPNDPATSLKDMAINLIIFTAVGALLSAIGISGSAILDRSFRFPIDVTHIVDLPVLATVPNGAVRLRWYRRLFRSRKRAKPAAPEPETGVVPESTPVLAENSEHQVETADSILDLDPLAAADEDEREREEAVTL
ncbi:MAG: lipopolysaccharide biosynthesis protein [Chloroflexi bacterium]|nr:lipopolysaccharide biosynthesis protein [Chloroflexota bacterium]